MTASLVGVSIQVQLDDLQRVLADFDAGYLTTVSAGSPARVKVVSVLAELADGVLTVPGPGRGSCANAAAHPDVTLVWPPRAPGGFSLIVDGAADVRGDDLLVTPTGAVLHKPVAAGVRTAASVE